MFTYSKPTKFTFFLLKSRMLEWQNLSKNQVLQKLAKYKSDKRIQGFKRHKARSDLMKMKKAVRQLEIGIEPTNEMRANLKVSF